MRGSKDAALAVTMRRLLSARFDTFGEVTELSVDTGRRRAHIVLALRGETVPIVVDIRRYDVERVNGNDCLSVVEAVTSREWLTVALDQFVVGRRFPLSRHAGAVVRLLM